MSAEFEKARALFVAGVEAFDASRYVDAQKCFAASLELLPARSSTLINLAATLVRLGRPSEAIDALDRMPDQSTSGADPWRHRGEALHQLQRYDEALMSYDRALSLDSASAATWFHRAAALDALQRHDDALAALDRVIAIEPASAEAWLRRGQTLQQLERDEPALASYDKAIELDRTMVVAWTNRGGLLKDMGQLEDAAQSFREAIDRGGDREVNSYLLASVTGADIPGAAPKAYVEQLFDEYASAFDQHLVGVLRYQGHDLLIAHLRRCDPREFQSALDLGCGTGLCGKLIRAVADDVTGVDLSQRMLDRAAQRKIYARLIHAEIVEFLRETDSRHDLVVAADVFIYIGDLAPVFEGIARVLEPGGIFCFSTERADDDKDYELRTSLRYGQSERYVRRLASGYGFEVADVLRHPLREDKQASIAGLYAYLRKPGSPA